MPVTSFNGKVAAITGAGSGMGQWLAILLSRAGCHVAISDVNQTTLDETMKLLDSSVNATSHVVDVADRSAMEAFAAEVNEKHGGINMIFNNAGVSVTGLAEQMPYEDIEWLMNINFWGVIHGCKSFLPFLREAKEAAIVNTSSIFGTIAVPSQSAYNASKFAVKGYTFALRTELADSHIGVSCVQPGGVKTNIVASSRFIPIDNQSETKEELTEMFERMAGKSAEEAAQIILDGVLRNKARILVGKDARVMAWVEKWFPTGYLRLMQALRNRRQLQESTK
ncbi:MAG: SDR family NAD(P)-dependent oxidoreductase [Pseudomonadales bacterium]|nr:SDR family NAD(P)-dependent oxidoreductase [Pseudomonadales bacterium]